MNRDPVVEEIHRVRDKILEECNGDLDKLMDRLKKRELEDQERIISLEWMKRERDPISAIRRSQSGCRQSGASAQKVVRLPDGDY